LTDKLVYKSIKNSTKQFVVYPSERIKFKPIR